MAADRRVGDRHARHRHSDAVLELQLYGGLLDHLVSGEDSLGGAVVGPMTGSVSAADGPAITFGDPVQIGSGHVDIEPLSVAMNSQTRLIVEYDDMANEHKFRLQRLYPDSTPHITLSAIIPVPSDTLPNNKYIDDLVRLDDTRFLIVQHEYSASYMYAWVGTISENDISWGSRQTVSIYSVWINGYTLDYIIDAVPLDSNRVAILWAGYQGGNNIASIVLDIDGDSITGGIPSPLPEFGHTNNHYLIALDPSRMVIFTPGNPSSASIATVNPNTSITTGGLDYMNEAPSYPMSCPVSPTSFMLMGHRFSETSVTTDMVLCSVGENIETVDSLSIEQYVYEMVALMDEHVLLTIVDPSDFSVSLAIATIDGYNIVLGEAHAVPGIAIDNDIGLNEWLRVMAFRGSDDLIIFDNINTMVSGHVDLYSEPPPAPIASFTASSTAGTAPLTVQFTDTSTGPPTAWEWNFGDGTTSTEQNPVHLYETPGIYTVSLRASSLSGSDIMIRTGFVTVIEPIPEPEPDTVFGECVTYNHLHLSDVDVDTIAIDTFDNIRCVGVVKVHGDKGDSVHGMLFDIGDDSLTMSGDTQPLFDGNSIDDTHLIALDTDITLFVGVDNGSLEYNGSFILRILSTTSDGIMVGDEFKLELPFEIRNESLSSNVIKMDANHILLTYSSHNSDVPSTLYTVLCSINENDISFNPPTPYDVAVKKHGVAVLDSARFIMVYDDAPKGGDDRLVAVVGSIDGDEIFYGEPLIIMNAGKSLDVQFSLIAMSDSTFAVHSKAQVSEILIGNVIGTTVSITDTASVFDSDTIPTTIIPMDRRHFMMRTVKEMGLKGDVTIVTVNEGNISLGLPTEFPCGVPAITLPIDGTRFGIIGMPNNAAENPIGTIGIVPSLYIFRPNADFQSTLPYGAIPFPIEFSDTSTNEPLSWHWDFGDGNTSAERDPKHIYEKVGKFNVSLRVDNEYGHDTVSKTVRIVLECYSDIFIKTDMGLTRSMTNVVSNGAMVMTENNDANFIVSFPQKFAGFDKYLDILYTDEWGKKALDTVPLTYSDIFDAYTFTVPKKYMYGDEIHVQPVCIDGERVFIDPYILKFRFKRSLRNEKRKTRTSPYNLRR